MARNRGGPSDSSLLVLAAVEVVAALLVAAADERRVDVDLVLDAQAGVDELFDLLDADLVHVPADAIAVVGHLVHHLAIRLAEPEIVLEEVAVAVDVRHHQLLVDQLVVRHQVGVARVVVDDHFVDLLQTVVVALAEPFVLHAEPPVRVADRKAALGGDGVGHYPLPPKGMLDLRSRSGGFGGLDCCRELHFSS